MHKIKPDFVLSFFQQMFWFLSSQVLKFKKNDRLKVPYPFGFCVVKKSIVAGGFGRGYPSSRLGTCEGTSYHPPRTGPSARPARPATAGLNAGDEAIGTDDGTLLEGKRVHPSTAHRRACSASTATGWETKCVRRGVRLWHKPLGDGMIPTPP